MEVKLIVVGGKNHGQEVPVSGPQFVIGRDEGCNLRPQSDQVSRQHTAILVKEGLVAVRDLGSSNGTYVNGERIESEQQLKMGDHLKVGPLEFEVKFSVGVGKKKRPKVRSVQEAAARTVETAMGDEADITEWLDEDEESEPAVTGPTDTQRTAATGPVSGGTSDAAAKPVEKPKTKQCDKEQGPAKLPGRFQSAKKPAATTSQSAAEEKLRKFFSRK